MKKTNIFKDIYMKQWIPAPEFQYFDDITFTLVR